MTRGLSLTQERFVNGILAGKSATKAAEGAGYSSKSARCTGHRLMRNPLVITALEDARNAIRKEGLDDATAVLASLQEAIQLAIRTGNAMAYVSALDLKARILGLGKRRPGPMGAPFQLTITGLATPKTPQAPREVPGQGQAGVLGFGDFIEGTPSRGRRRSPNSRNTDLPTFL